MAFLDNSKMKKMVRDVTTPAHPVLNVIGEDEAVKTAYVQGCALATLLDDCETSEEEMSRVLDIGLSLRLDASSIHECFDVVNGLGTDDDKMAFVGELVSLLKAEKIRSHFIEDFKAIISLGGQPTNEAKELYDLIGALLYSDEDWQNKIAQERKKKSDAIQLKRLDSILVDTVEKNMEWPASYDRKSLLNACAECGVKEHKVQVLLSLLLVHAKAALERFRNEINRLDYVSGPDYRSIDLRECENTLTLLNYLKCMDDCCVLDEKYGIVEKGDGENSRWWSDRYRMSDSNYIVRPDVLRWKWRGKNAESDAKKSLIALYKSLINEFEFRASY